MDSVQQAKQIMMRIAAILVLLGTLALVASDAYFRFDQERVIAKRQHQSSQRHWSLFYRQDYTYTDSSFKYQHDISSIKQLVEPNKVLLSDKASSYYLAAELPVFVKNTQIHHYRRGTWRQILAKSYFCYIDHDEYLDKVKKFITSQALKDDGENQAKFKYWVINHDPNNLNLKYDCLATRSAEISSSLEKIARLKYKGDYLWLYEIL